MLEIFICVILLILFGKIIVPFIGGIIVFVLKVLYKLLKVIIIIGFIIFLFYFIFL